MGSGVGSGGHLPYSYRRTESEARAVKLGTIIEIDNGTSNWQLSLTILSTIRWYGENYYWNEITFAHRRTLGNRGNCRALRLRAVPLIRRSIAKCSSFLTNYSKSTAEQKFSVPPNHLSHCFGHFFFNANQFGNSLNCWPTTVCLVKWFIRSQSILYTDAAYNENPFEWSGFSIKKEFLDLFGTCVSFQKPLLFT